MLRWTQTYDSRSGLKKVHSNPVKTNLLGKAKRMRLYKSSSYLNFFPDCMRMPGQPFDQQWFKLTNCSRTARTNTGVLEVFFKSCSSCSCLLSPGLTVVGVNVQSWTVTSQKSHIWLFFFFFSGFKSISSERRCASPAWSVLLTKYNIYIMLNRWAWHALAMQGDGQKIIDGFASLGGRSWVMAVHYGQSFLCNNCPGLPSMQNLSVLTTGR